MNIITVINNTIVAIQGMSQSSSLSANELFNYQIQTHLELFATNLID